MNFALSKLLDILQSIGLSLRRHSDFLGHVVTLGLGNAAALVISFLLTPIISRFFEPAHYGVAALFISVATIVGNTAPLYNRGVVLPGENLQAILLLRLAVSILAVICVTSFLLMSLLHFLTIPIPLADQLDGWIWLLPVAVLLVGLAAIFESWITRVKAFTTLAYADFSLGLLTMGSRLSLGWVFGSSTWALLGGYALGLFGRLVLLVQASVPNLRNSLSKYSTQDLIDTAKEYKDFPLYNALARFVLDLSQNLPILLLGYLFSPVVAGFYAMANRLVGMPLNIGVNAFRRVYLQKTAELRNDGRPLRNTVYKTTAGLALSGIIPFGLLWLFGKSVLTITLGERWAEAGEYVEILSPWLFMVWVTAPSSTMMIVLRKQSMWMWIQLGILGLRLGVFLAAYALSATPEWTLSTFSIVGVLCQVGIMVNSFRLVRQPIKESSVQNLSTTG